MLYGKQAVDQCHIPSGFFGGYDLSDAISLGVNASYNETMGLGGFYGAALYPAVANKKVLTGMRKSLKNSPQEVAWCW